MQKAVLQNGLTVLYEHKPGASVVVEALINVGSAQEAPDERGLAHFLEHMLFEGTTKRPTTLAITNEIEKIGGEFNAYTTHERTCFYIKVLQKHFPKAVEILADILQHPLFQEEQIRKEKQIVLKEIALVNDEPRSEQWILLQHNLFPKHPCRFPTYGSPAVIRSLSREKLQKYFSTYYQPNNMVLCIAGDVPGWRQFVGREFHGKRGKDVPYRSVTYALPRKSSAQKVKRRSQSTYLVMGFPTVPRKGRESYAFDVINAILGRGQSGRLFTEIRSNRGLAYDVGTQHVAERGFGYFALYATVDKKNVPLVREVMLQELQRLMHVSNTELREAKTFIEGDYLLDLDDTQKIADQLLFWEQVQDARLADEYLKKIKAVTAADVRRVVQKYLQKETLVVLEGK